MDPGRAAMISGGARESPDRRVVTAPRHDNRNRISKPTHYNPDSSSQPPGPSRQYQRPGNRSDYGGVRGGGVNRNGNRLPPQAKGMTDEDRFVAETDTFVIRQTKKRADIRVRERRGHLIDFLVFNIRFIDEDHDAFDDEIGDEAIEVPLADDVLATTDEAKLTELEGELEALVTLEKNRQNLDYFSALLVLCRDILKKRSHDEAGQVLGSVASDVDKLLRPKSLDQLEALEKQFKAKLQSDAVIDTDYWQNLLKQLKVYKAKAIVTKISDKAREKRLALLRERKPEKTAKEAAESGDDEGMDGEQDEGAVVPAGATSTASLETAPPPGTGRFAPLGNEDFSQATKALYDREAARGVGENEEIFAAEEIITTAMSNAAAKPKWADKYRPRKPRYFNRVQMGYEWNKYNQTHYDHDNPPPKVVQGYKFNLFYPELIDKTKAPTYHITREGGRRKGESFAAAGEEDTCLIRFSAGPPYEDVAFRIVDREWDYSSKRERGFKSVFENGILQLHFQFKKVYYRK